MIADLSVKVQACCRSSVRAATEYGPPFSETSFNVIVTSGGDEAITLQDGRRFAPRGLLEVV